MGKGLGSFLIYVDVKKSVSYQEISNFPELIVEFHKGNLVLGNIEGKKSIILPRRLYYYEEYSLQEITFLTRIHGVLGIKRPF